MYIGNIISTCLNIWPNSAILWSLSVKSVRLLTSCLQILTSAFSSWLQPSASDFICQLLTSAFSFCLHIRHSAPAFRFGQAQREIKLDWLCVNLRNISLRFMGGQVTWTHSMQSREQGLPFELLIVTLTVSQYKHFHDGSEFQIMKIWDRQTEGKKDKARYWVGKLKIEANH